MNKTLVILNPAAHSQRAVRWRGRVEELARDAEICSTTRPGDAEGIARHAALEGFETVVAAGGDGTINEVVNGIAGTDAALGLLPIGTMNVFATEMGIPVRDLGRCWEIIRAQQTRVIDLPKANDKHFVQLAGVGLDAQVVQETSLAFKRNFGPLSYLISAAQIAARTPPQLHLECDDASTKEASFVLVGNGRLYGGPFPFFKNALSNDGLLDVIVFKQFGYLEIIKYLQNVIFTSAITLPEVDYFQTSRLRVTSDGAVPVEIDGELADQCPVLFEIEKRTVRVCAPLL